MEESHLALLKSLSSAKRQRILDLLANGMGHPEDLAGAMNLTRQAVDHQLDLLRRSGMVQKSAFISEKGRPKVIYHVRPGAEKYLKDLVQLSQAFLSRMKGEYDFRLRELDEKLITGQMSEGTYKKEMKALKREHDIIVQNHER